MSRLTRIVLLVCCATLAPIALGQEYVAYVTGENADGDPVVFAVIFDITMADSAALTEAVSVLELAEVDGIDFVPDTGNTEVIGTIPSSGIISHYNVVNGVNYDQFIEDTTTVPEGAEPDGETRPSSILSVDEYYYYVENQFGFDTATDHRIILAPFDGTDPSVAFDGAEAEEELFNFEGLELIDDRLYFFAEDRDDDAARALYSIPLDDDGIWDSAADDPEPIKHIGGLAEGPFPGAGPLSSDGSDELDYDDTIDVLFGTNIINGEIIAWDVAFEEEIIPGMGGSLMHFIDGEAIMDGADDGLATLLRGVDGIRADGEGRLVFAGRGGILGVIAIDGVLFDGADDDDVYPLFDDTDFTFDELTPLIPPPAGFIRGDVDGVDPIGLLDVLDMLDFMYTAGEVPCVDAVDVNDDGELILDDPILLLRYIFLDGADPEFPFPDCGGDPSPDELDCETPPDCP